MKNKWLLLASVILLVGSLRVARADDAAPEAVKPGTVRVAGIVLKWLRTDKEANYRRAELMIRRAAGGGAQIVCTTECFLDGYAIADISIPLKKYRALGEPIPDGKYFRRLSGLADKLDIYLIAGMLEADGDDRYNTAVVIGPDGKLIGRYHKQKLGHEAVRNAAGYRSSVFRTEFGNVGVMICADRRFKDVVGRFCSRGADFLICPSGGMFGPKRNDPILQSRSRENGRHIVFVHPAEFLVTAPGGKIAQRTIFGDRLLIAADQIGKDEDSSGVFYFDLPLPKPKPATYDVLIRGGTIIDGTGRPRYRADVGIHKGRIVAVGDLKGAKATVVIDAADRIVCPGFIDLHSHADRGILKHRPAENYIRQGVTTLLCGNCGSSPTDVAEFFRRLRNGGTGPNVALLIGHGSVREKVMGRLNVPPSDEQLAEMRRLVRRAMQDGAVGLSTSLRYGPGAYATTEEVIDVTNEIAPFGGFYATHMRDEGTRILEAMEEAFLIGRKAGVPVHISHHKISSASVFGLTRQTLMRIDQLRKTGMDVTLDQYPYGAGSGGMSLYVPQSSLSGGLPAFRKRIADPKQKAAIIEAVEELLVRKIYEADQSPADSVDTAQALSRIRVARAAHDPKLEGRTLTEILRSRGRPVTLRNGALLLVEFVSKGTVGINHTLEERPGGDVDRVMRHPLTAIASDGGVFPFGAGNPHPRSYGCYPRVLGHYVRERKLLTLEQAIYKMTSLPARRLGWRERGTLSQGDWADVVVFDPDKIIDRATFADPHQYSIGVEHVLVRGRFVLRSEKMTGKLPGQPLRKEKKSEEDDS